MGRMIDADVLREEVYSWGMNDYEPSDFTDAIDDAPTVEAIPKDQYENRLKADMVAMLKEMRAEMEYVEPHDMGEIIILNACKQVVDTRINSLKEQEDGTNEKTSD